jgi:hypothetical protein
LTGHALYDALLIFPYSLFPIPIPQHMKLTQLASLIVSAAIVVSAQAAPTIFTGGACDTLVTLTQFGAAGPVPTVEATDGNPGGRLQITPMVNGLQNVAAFDRTQTGTVPSTGFSFDFQIVATVTASADGFHFALINTSINGASGAGANMGEDPTSAGVLGFGFDTWSNRGIPGSGAEDPNSPDDPAQAQGSNYDEISIFYNGALIQRINDTRLLAVPLTLDDGAWHRATGNVNFSGGTASLSVDGNPIFTNTAVPGLTPYESRVQFGGRTGGENEQVSIDNVNVSYVPEPTAAVLGGTGLALMLLRRRR